MRKTVYLASALAVALAMATMSCSSKDEGGKSPDNKIEQEAAAKQKAESKSKPDSTKAGEGRETAMAAYIRYVDAEKIQKEYILARELSKADSTAQIKLASYQQQLQSGLERQGQQIQEKMQRNGYLSEASYNADVAQFQRAQQDAAGKLEQRQRDYATDVSAKAQQLSDSVKSVVNFMAKKYKLDAVLDKAAGAYFNPALDITDEVVKELNSRYKSGKK